MDQLVVKRDGKEKALPLPEYGTVTICVKDGVITRTTVENSYLVDELFIAD